LDRPPEKLLILFVHVLIESYPLDAKMLHAHPEAV
jgi:hypothetical protein